MTGAAKAGAAIGIILTVAALLGMRVLGLFNVSLDAFMVAGGGVLAWLGFNMLSGQPAAANAKSTQSLTALILFAASPGTYNFPNGWYLTTSPILTANWAASSSRDVWTVPLGGGFGKVIHLGKLPVNLSVQAFYNVATPQYGVDWSIRLQCQLLFPK